MGFLGNSCCKNKKKATVIEKAGAIASAKEDLKFHRATFIYHKTEKFKDNYLIGQCMGCGVFGEVRKCK